MFVIHLRMKSVMKLIQGENWVKKCFFHPMGPETKNSTIHCSGVTVSFCIGLLILLSLLSLITESLSGLVVWMFPMESCLNVLVPSWLGGYSVLVSNLCKKKDFTCKTRLKKTCTRVAYHRRHLSRWKKRVSKKRKTLLTMC